MADASPHRLRYTNLPSGSAIVYEEHEGRITLIDRPRMLLGRHGPAIGAAMMVLLALSFAAVMELTRRWSWGAVALLAGIWIVCFPLLIDRIWKGRLPGVIEAGGGKLAHTRADFRGRMIREEWPAASVRRIVVVPFSWSWRLRATGEVRVVIADGGVGRMVRVLRGYSMEELEWAAAAMRDALGAKR
jgi:hypothetical protein